MESLPLAIPALLAQTTQLLQQIFGTSAEIAAHTILLQKEDYVVLRVQLHRILSLPAHDLILKLAGPHAPLACPFEQSAAIHQLVAAQSSLLMPRVFAADSTYQSWPWRYFVREHVEGIEWAKISNTVAMPELTNLHRQLGAAVAQLHGIQFPAFGEVEASGEVQDGKPFLTALKARARCTIQNTELRARFLACVAQHADLFASVGKAALCHEDLHKHNLLVRQVGGRWRLLTILDFDKAWAGCPESDLARLELWTGMTSTSFWEGYRAQHGVAPLYPQRRSLFQLLWCLEYAKPTAQHLADTNRLGAELGLSDITDFG